ncbi:unnamed protein product [Echinostoma caproni]|uniref:Uncharacterized protein n=1 Tax=Echinostoma caproni TaxID=27848 RepID=A0A183AJA3_9TREM|nr:unnamed protein product [Echinostoma caproni]
MEDICHKILDLYPAGTPVETTGPSTTPAPRHMNPMTPSNSSTSLRNHPSFHIAASAANTVGNESLSRRSRVGSTHDNAHVYPVPTHAAPHTPVAGLQPPLPHVAPVMARGVRRGA